MRLLAILAALVLFAAAVDSAPFFDAIYDALNGNGRRSYGYSGYGNYGYGQGYDGYAQGYEGYSGYRRQPEERATRRGKTYKDLCRVHFPESVAVPGKGGIICPY